MEQRGYSSKWEKRGRIAAGRIIRSIAAGVVFLLIAGIFVFLLWNWLMPVIFNLRGITFWQAVGLVALSRILFSGKGMHTPGYGSSGERGVGGGWGLCPHSGGADEKRPE